MGWTEYDLGTLLSYEQPTTYIVETTDYKDTFKTPVLTAGKTFIIGYTNETHGIYTKNPVIIFDDFTTSTQYVNFPFKVKSSAMKILSVNESLAVLKFMYYRMQMIDFDHSTHKRYWIQHYSKIKVRIPSLPEQIRIVFRIEELFSDLDKAVEILQTIKQQLMVYRQAVLKGAFGSLSDCKKELIGSLCEAIVDCPHSTPVWTSEGKICLRTTNFRRGYLDLSERNYVSTDTFNLRNSRLLPRRGDVLYSREGAILGIACIIPDNLEVCLGQRMMLLRTSNKMNNKFLMHYLNSPFVTNHVVRITGGSASPHINVKDIKNFSVPIPEYSKQIAIVSNIEANLSTCDFCEQMIDNTLLQSQALRQSILRSFFTRGAE